MDKYIYELLLLMANQLHINNMLLNASSPVDADKAIKEHDEMLIEMMERYHASKSK